MLSLSCHSTAPTWFSSQFSICPFSNSFMESACSTWTWGAGGSQVETRGSLLFSLGTLSWAISPHPCLQISPGLTWAIISHLSPDLSPELSPHIATTYFPSPLTGLNPSQTSTHSNRTDHLPSQTVFPGSVNGIATHPPEWVRNRGIKSHPCLSLLRPSSSLSPLPASTPLHLYHTTLAEASYPLLDNYNSPMGSSNIDFRLYQSIPSLVEIRIIFSKQKSDHHLLNSIKPSMVLESQDKTWLINTPYKALQVWHN